MLLTQGTQKGVNIRLIYSPISESVLTFHVMCDPYHHVACCDWVKKKFNTLPTEMQEEILFFGKKFADWIFIIDLFGSVELELNKENSTIDKVIQGIRSMEKTQLVKSFLGLDAFNHSDEIINQWIENPEEITEDSLGVQAQFFQIEDVRDFLKNTEQYLERIFKLISRYWTDHFHQDWIQIEKYLKKAIRKEVLLINQNGINDYIRALHPDIELTEHAIRYRKDPPFELSLDKLKTIYVAYSVFTAPHLAGNVINDVAMITKNLNFHSVKMQLDEPKDLHDLLFAASDTTRLKIIKMAWNSDVTTKEMAEVLELNPSTISLHLKVLKKAGLLESNKVKKYVYYRLKKEKFKTLQNSLIEYLEY